MFRTFTPGEYILACRPVEYTSEEIELIKAAA